MARPEPFRGLLDEASLAEPAPILRMVPPVSSVVSASLTPVLDDDQHSLERRLDAAILAAGATPPHGLRATQHSGAQDLLGRRGTFDPPSEPRTRSSELVPLRLDPPQREEQGSNPPVSLDVNASVTSVYGIRAPRMLQFLHDDLRTALDSVLPRLEPVGNCGSLSAGVQTNIYQLRARNDDRAARPLPALATSDEVVDTVRSRVDKVASRKSAEELGIDLRVFCFDDSDEDDGNDQCSPFSENSLAPTDGSDRLGRAVAAIALPALSDDDVGELGTVDDLAGLGTIDELDELARQLGILAVPRHAQPRTDDELGSALLRSTPPRIDPFGMVMMGCVPQLDDDDEFDDELEVTAPRGPPLSLLPASLFDGLDENTPGFGRAAFSSPEAVRFVSAPARPGVETLSAEEDARNKLRAHDLYLVAMDDLGEGDADGAMVHLELAVAYDDTQSLYLDLLERLKKKTKQ